MTPKHELQLNAADPALETDALSNAGTATKVASFLVNVGEAPLARRLPDTFLGSESARFDAVLVPHTVNIVRVEGFREITQFGMHVTYVPELPGQTCSVIRQIPAASFIANGEFSAAIAADGTLSGTGGVSTESVAGVKVGAGTFAMRQALTATVGASLQCRFKVLTPKIAAVGTGSREAIWTFDAGGDVLLHGTPIETYSLLVVPKGLTTVRYSMRIWMRHKIVLFTSYWEAETRDLVEAEVGAFPEKFGSH